MSNCMKQYPPLLIEMFDQIERELIQHEVNEQSSKEIAKNIVDSIRSRFGGSALYIPKGENVDIKTKYDAIKKDFDGGNHAELCLKYGLSIQRIYKILKAVKKQPVLRNR